MELTADEESLLIVGVAYIAGVALWAWTLVVRSNILLRDLGERIEPGLWQSLGAPKSMQDALNDPEKRWWRFVQKREYRRRCSEEVIDMIEDFRRRQNWMLVVIGGAGLMILLRYRTLLFAAAFS